MCYSGKTYLHALSPINWFTGGMGPQTGKHVGPRRTITTSDGGVFKKRLSNKSYRESSAGSLLAEARSGQGGWNVKQGPTT